jgi:hypothetical protein
MEGCAKTAVDEDTMLVIMNSNAALLFMVTPFSSRGMACKDEVGTGRAASRY